MVKDYLGAMIGKIQRLDREVKELQFSKIFSDQKYQKLMANYQKTKQDNENLIEENKRLKSKLEGITELAKIDQNIDKPVVNIPNEELQIFDLSDFKASQSSNSVENLSAKSG